MSIAWASAPIRLRFGYAKIRKNLQKSTQIRKNPVYVALFATVCLIIPFALETMVRSLQSWAGCDTWKTFAVLVIFTMFTTFLYLFGRMLATRCFTCTC